MNFLLKEYQVKIEGAKGALTANEYDHEIYLEGNEGKAGLVKTIATAIKLAEDKNKPVRCSFDGAEFNTRFISDPTALKRYWNSKKRNKGLRRSKDRRGIVVSDEGASPVPCRRADNHSQSDAEKLEAGFGFAGDFD